MYHRIIPDKEAEPGLQAGMHVEPETFDMHIQYLKNFFNIIPFPEILTYIKDISVMKRSLPICVITFDDGWYDFFKFGYPILEAHRVPATVFLPTKFIGTRNRFWTDEVASLIARTKNPKYHQNRERISNSSEVEKLAGLAGKTETKIEKAISILKNYRDDEIFYILTELKKMWRIDPISVERAFLTWEEVEKMAGSGLITFGSHTNNHKILTYLNDKEVMEEMIESKNKLLSERLVNPSFIPFCYPNGKYDERVVRMVEEAGYHLAVTTENGWNHPSTPLFNLQRIGIHQDMSSSKEMFGCRITNLL
jgi:peptidoglycan/xylan/chitin deacetylase (PgdA/CDA1 family)